MKVSQFRALIREEVRKVINEADANSAKISIGPFYDTAKATNAKLEPIVKSFIKNAKQKKGSTDTYWLHGIFDKNAFDKAKEKYSLTLEFESPNFVIEYPFDKRGAIKRQLMIHPVAFLSDKEFANIIGYISTTNDEPDTPRPFSKQVESALAQHINQYNAYKKLDALLKSNKIPKKYLTYSGTVYRLVSLKDTKSLQSYLSSPKSMKSTSTSFGISCAKSINGIKAYIENAMEMDGVVAGLIFRTNIESSKVLLDIDSMINDLFDYEEEMGIESNIAYEGEEEVILKSPITFSPDMLVATVTDSKIKNKTIK